MGVAIQGGFVRLAGAIVPKQSFWNLGVVVVATVALSLLQGHAQSCHGFGHRGLSRCLRASEVRSCEMLFMTSSEAKQLSVGAQFISLGGS
jgi:hypothetical protein